MNLVEKWKAGFPLNETGWRGELHMDKGFIFDLDGTIYIDDHLIDGVLETINRLREKKYKILFLTNKSIATREEYCQKLRKLGIEVTMNEIINSNYITAKYLKEHMDPRDSVLVIGEQPLIDELAADQINMTKDPLEAAYIVVGWDRNYTYEKINLAYQAWKNGAKIIATNPDKTCPVENGDIPDCAAMIGAIEGTTGEKIDAVIGKPSKYLADYVVNEILQLSPDQCYVIGDRLETDILMGNESGINTILVLSGISSLEDVEDSPHQPDYVLESVKGIPELIGGL